MRRCVFSFFGVSRKIIKNICFNIILCVFSRLKKISTGKCTLIFRIFGLFEPYLPRVSGSILKEWKICINALPC